LLSAGEIEEADDAVAGGSDQRLAVGGEEQIVDAAAVHEDVGIVGRDRRAGALVLVGLGRLWFLDAEHDLGETFRRLGMEVREGLFLAEDAVVLKLGWTGFEHDLRGLGAPFGGRHFKLFREFELFALAGLDVLAGELGQFFAVLVEDPLDRPIVALFGNGQFDLERHFAAGMGRVADPGAGEFLGDGGSREDNADQREV
jgi:hypothetical protein